MTGHTYLLKSRHGVYYFRAALPKSHRSQSGAPKREIRISLRTKDKYIAKRRVAIKVLLMSQEFDVNAEIEADADKRQALYNRGLTLIRQFGNVDLADEFHLDALAQELSGPELEAYAFAQEYIASQPKRATETAASNELAHSAVGGDGLASPDLATDPTMEVAPIKVGSIKDGSTKVASASAKSDETVARAIERFVDQKSQHADRATADKYGTQCKLFAKVVAQGRPVLMLSHLTADDIRYYLDTLPKLPKKTLLADTRSIDEIIKSPGDRMAPKTKFSHAQAVNMFLTWCEEQQYAIIGNVSKLLKPLLKKPKPCSKDKAYSAEELNLIFGCERYLNGTWKRASDYWVPILSLFTGAREGELCQLKAADVSQDQCTGLWLLDINQKGDNNLKNASSKRRVPIHPQIINLGFLDFVATRKGALFPDEPRNKRGEFSAFSKRYNYFKRSLGIASDNDNKKDFHSFRHTMQTLLLGLGCEEYIVNAACGHSKARSSEGVRTYSKGPGFQAIHDVLLKLQYPIDFSKIRPNGWLHDCLPPANRGDALTVGTSQSSKGLRSTAGS